ncbi:MAG TPA: hypothetical protein VLR27_06175 [Acidimicrobiales bacterium]|nr:hypothetical protein [Acidimicrobiales bacterium]
MSDDQDHPRPGGDARTERTLDELLALRADVAALLGRFASLQRSLVGEGQHSLIEQLQDNLADVASGDVVSALWDEVRAVRAQLDEAATSVAPVVAAPVEPAGPDPQLAALTDELAVLRTELADGLVVEPSDALSASLDALRSEVDGLREALGELRDAPVPAPADGGRDDDAVLQRLGTIEAGIDELRGRLDEGLVLADDTELPAPAAGGGADVEAIADQVAALRDFVASELDTVRQTVSARIDAATETTVAAASARPEPAPAPAVGSATIDPDTLEQLREEIRAAGTVSDQVIDALRDELKALRRRIAVKATERVLDDQQLAQIADAVAARLADDRDRA